MVGIDKKIRVNGEVRHASNSKTKEVSIKGWGEIYLDNDIVNKFEEAVTEFLMEQQVVALGYQEMDYLMDLDNCLSYD